MNRLHSWINKFHTFAPGCHSVFSEPDSMSLGRHTSVWNQKSWLRFWRPPSASKSESFFVRFNAHMCFTGSQMHDMHMVARKENSLAPRCASWELWERKNTIFKPWYLSWASYSGAQDAGRCSLSDKVLIGNATFSTSSGCLVRLPLESLELCLGADDAKGVFTITYRTGPFENKA